MKKILIILAVLVGLVLLVVGGIVALGVLYVFTAEDIAVTAPDEELLVTASDLVPYFEGFSPQTAHETREKIRYIDDSEELNYEFDSGADDEPWISVTVSWEKTAKDADMVYGMGWSAQMLVFNAYDSGIDAEEDNDYYSAGDRSRFAFLTYEDHRTGNMLVVQKGRTVYNFSLTGFYIDDPEIWHDLFDARIAGLTDL